MARSNGRSGRNNNPSGRNQYRDWGVMDMVRERPVAAAAAVASAAAAGLFLWSKRTRISEQLSSLSDQIGEWSLGMGSNDGTGGTTTATPSGPGSPTGSERGTGETGSGRASPGRSSGGAGSGGTASGRGRARSTATTEP